jgi:N-methylhydantoinase A
MALDGERAAASIETGVGAPLGLDEAEAASAILRLATENMVGAIEEITINQGIDPRGAVLVGGGGAAGLNSVAIARRLGCRAVVIPEVGAALSAAGALMSDLQADHRALHYAATDRFDFDGVNRVLDSLTARCAEFIEGPGTGGTAHAVDLYAEARYRHQIWEIDLPLQLDRFDSDADVSGVREDFDRLHEEVFAFRDPGSDVEFVGWRATARARLGAGGFGRLEAEGALEAGVSGSRTAYFAGLGAVETDVELFEAMDPGAAVEGPAVIESAFTTVVVDPGATAVRTEGGTLVITP